MKRRVIKKAFGRCVFFKKDGEDYLSIVGPMYTRQTKGVTWLRSHPDIINYLMRMEFADWDGIKDMTNYPFQNWDTLSKNLKRQKIYHKKGKW